MLTLSRLDPLCPIVTDSQIRIGRRAIDGFSIGDVSPIGVTIGTTRLDGKSLQLRPEEPGATMVRSLARVAWLPAVLGHGPGGRRSDERTYSSDWSVHRVVVLLSFLRP